MLYGEGCTFPTPLCVSPIGVSPIRRAPHNRRSEPSTQPRTASEPSITRNTMPDYDLIVLGAGPAGEKGAAQAAYYGKRVVIVERTSNVGGAAINTGTIPSKTLRETALYFSGLRQRGLYGIDYSLREGLTVKDFMYRERAVVEQERGIIQRNLDRHEIVVIPGVASLPDAHTVRVRRD